MRRPFLASTLLFLAPACVPRTVPPPMPAPTAARPAPAPRPVPLAADWREWPVTPGDWIYRRDGRGSIALFGPRGTDALLVIRCDQERRQIFVSIAGTQAATVTVRTSSTARSVSLAPTGGEPPYLAAALAPADPLLDAMGFSRGRFTIERAGTMPLVVPAWADIERVTEDCRS